MSNSLRIPRRQFLGAGAAGLAATLLPSGKAQYTTGVKDPELVSPDGAAHDQFLFDRKDNDEIQLDQCYGSNPPLYPKWQEYFRSTSLQSSN